MDAFENAAGAEVRSTAERHSAFLRVALTPENTDVWKNQGLIDDVEIALLSECIDHENYIAKSNQERAHIDQLVESLRESTEAK